MGTVSKDKSESRGTTLDKNWRRPDSRSWVARAGGYQQGVKTKRETEASYLRLWTMKGADIVAVSKSKGSDGCFHRLSCAERPKVSVLKIIFQGFFLWFCCFGWWLVCLAWPRWGLRPAKCWTECVPSSPDYSV